jgi:hypothetical protein
MAVTQISRIQHRRGLEQDLPQLASAELGWSLDTRKLYIGNGTTEEGAPEVGVTRILTEYDVADITSNVEFTSYTFVGNAAGYTAQTGPSLLAPVVRTYQQKLDDIINVRDFGATGDGVTDDTSAINRAIQQIYKSTVSPSDSRARRTIYFPGGTYVISSPVLIPPYAKLVGDGIGSAIITQLNANQNVAKTCDSSFQTDSSIGTSSATVPKDIQIAGLEFRNSNSSASSTILEIDSAEQVKISDCRFNSSATAGYYPNLVSILSSSVSSKIIKFENCDFINGGNGLSVLGSGVSSIKTFGCTYDNLSNVAINLRDAKNYVGVGNYFGSVGSFMITDGNNATFELGDYYETNNILNTGLYLGNLQISQSQQYNLSSTPLVLSIIGPLVGANSAVLIDYEIRSQANARFGTMTYVTTNTQTVFDDNYTETLNSVNANLFANTDSLIASVSSGTATFKFNFKTFL